MKELIIRIPILGNLAKRIYWQFTHRRNSAAFPGSAAYWENRYSQGGNSGAGSYKFFAEFKAEILNDFIAAHGTQSVIEFGCGDGNQLKLAKYPQYLGVDVSRTAIANCQSLFQNDQQKSFCTTDEYNHQFADLALSLDVIYHLVEDRVFESYMHTLFAASRRHVIVYASNTDDNSTPMAVHVKHRKFTAWVEKNRPDWKLIQVIPNRYPYRGNHFTGSFADFFIFELA